MITTDDQDVRGLIPDFSLCGNRYQHYKNKKIYKVTGYRFDSSIDTWVVCHHCKEDVLQNGKCAKYTRPINNFFETVEHMGQMVPRFALVEGK